MFLRKNYFWKKNIFEEKIFLKKNYFWKKNIFDIKICAAAPHLANETTYSGKVHVLCADFDISHNSNNNNVSHEIKQKQSALFYLSPTEMLSQQNR